jgi:hypothetical protein
MIKRSFIIFLFVIFIFSSVNDASSIRSIPNDKLGVPVKIALSDGTSGIGFYLNDDPFTYLVTSKHLLYNKNSSTPKAKMAELTSYGKDQNDLSPNIIQLYLEDMFTTKNLRSHDTHDVAIGRIGKVEIQNDSEVLKLYKWARSVNWANTGIVRVDRKNITKKFSEVLISNEIFVYGYPSSIGLKYIPQIDYNRPLLRKGIVAGVSPKTSTIIIDLGIYEGNIGCPVIEVNRNGYSSDLKLIGLISQYIPYAEEWLNRQGSKSDVVLSNSGYAVAIPVDFILEILWE